MANKITDKALRELILEVLDEAKNLPSSDPIQYTQMVKANMPTITNSIKAIPILRGKYGFKLKAAKQVAEHVYDEGPYPTDPEFQAMMANYSDDDKTDETGAGDKEEETGAGDKEEETGAGDKEEETGADEDDIVYDFDDNSTDVIDALKTTFGANISKKILSKIAALKEGIINEDKDKFEIDDIEVLMQKATDKPGTKLAGTGKTNLELASLIDVELKNFINKVQDPAMARKLVKAKIEYDRATQSSRGLNPEIDPTFAASSRIGMPASIGGDVKPPVDPVVFKSFETFFAGKTTFNARLTHLKKFSEAIVKASSNKPTALNAFSPEVIITGGNVMSMLSKLTRQMDPSAGGYFAEAFLAYLVGGSKTGQDQGAGDFKGTDGKNYSSKWGSSSKSQASSNFTTLDSRITYITADKATEGKAGTSKTMKVLKLTLNVYDIITTGVGSVGSGKSAGFEIELGKPGFKKGKGDRTETPKGASGKTSTGDYDVSPPSSAKEYVVTLVSASDEVFDQVFSKAVDNISSQVVKAAARFNALSRQLEENTTNYSVSSDFTEAVQMADTYAEIKTELAKIYTGKTGETDATKIGLAEQKITANFLKKLISESFKK